ncbi:MAG: flavoprotein [bacterium]
MKRKIDRNFYKKEIIVGITGSIAAYKACDLVHALKKCGANVNVIITENGKRFITPLSLQYLSGGRVYDDFFEIGTWSDKHIGLAERADIIVVAPASADFIARVALGRASDLLSATLLTTRSRVIIVPAMNSNMFTHQLTQANLERLRSTGYKILGPQKGDLACGEEGIGRMFDVTGIVDYLRKCLSAK